MNTLAAKYRYIRKDRAFMRSFLVSVGMLTASLFINFYAGTYATVHESNAVTDLILTNIRVYDVDGLFVYGGVVMVLLIVAICLYNPRKSPFVLKSIALFVIIRSVFITLTHIGPFPGGTVLDTSHALTIFEKFSFGGDLFFSGHTGLPFLIALLFWETKYIRYLFLGGSFFFAIVVLLGHLHYSIDVLAAFFITYTIAHLASLFFPEDFKNFRQERNVQLADEYITPEAK